MDDVKVTAAELKKSLAGDIDRLMQEMAVAMNAAQAGRIIADSVGASDDDVVIFAGSGATGAIDKLISILNLRIPADQPKPTSAI